MIKLGLAIFIFLCAQSAFAGSVIGVSALLSSPATMIFIALIFSFTIYLAFFRFNRFTVTHGPEILTTIGIFGCFFGIATSLLYFNSADLNNSIPMLLEGIKTAFWASVFGIGGALLIKIRHLFRKLPIPQSENVSQAKSLDDVVNGINTLQKSLVGNEEGTLLSQIKLLRQDSHDQLQQLKEAFEKFSMHMLENNQKAIIDALRQVIIDFNKNLTEQFGENFKQLNQGVDRLVIWQAQYKEELDLIKQAQMQAATDMQKAGEAFKTMVSQAQAFSSIAENLKILLEATNRQKNVLFSQEKALSELLMQMKDVTPEFTNKLSAILNEISKGVKQIQSETVDIVKNFGAQAQSANAEMKNLLAEVLSKTQKQLSEELQENARVIKEGVLALDKGLQTELNNSLSTLGSQLASLSEKFVSDYSPLTDRLREVVRLSEKI